MALQCRVSNQLSQLAAKVSGARFYSAPVNGSIPASKRKYVPTSGTYPRGFKVSGTIVGVKPKNTTKPDLAFITSDTPCAAAAVFTKNKFQAAPVTFSRALLQEQKNSGLRGVIINSGCANAVTGKGGLEDAERMAKEADKSLGADKATIVMSTGVIGQRLPIQKILDNIPKAYERLGDTHKHWLTTATAICTTDTFPKLISKTFHLPSSPSIEYRIAGTTKGAGMIHPNMATLLGVIATDAPISPAIIPPILKYAADRSFNSITIDGDTSTNDTIALLANGAAGGQGVTSEDSADFQAFRDIVTEFAIDLAKLVVRDGEGATKFVTIRVTESSSEEGARKIASTIARSPLVKTALYGKDANWGRILCATGYSLISEPGNAVNEVAEIVPEKTNVSFVPTDGSPELKLLVNGEPELVDEARAGQILEHEDLEIRVRLGTGNKEATYWTCDYSHEYMVEKYRPVFLDDVVGNTETIERLKIIAKDGNMPHVIISGMPGIGKTTSVLCLARQLLGDSYKEAVLELNASDERGIDVVRNRIKGFAQKKVTLPAGRHKLVILDEADSMTSGAQQALRRTMEIYSNTTRFAFACNQSNKIIEPLQSRCAILRYGRLTDAQVVKRLMQIIAAEKVQYSDDGLAALVFSAEGDMRQAINNLQSTSAGFGFVSGDNVFKVVDSPHPIKVQAMLKACHEGNVDSALDTLRELWDLGYSSHDIISTMFKVTKTIPTLSEHSKLEFIREIGFTHMKILEGVQTLLQLSGCVARLCKINMDPKRFETKSK
ncbi:DNA replication factor C-like protein [Annulohypoxylon bovei var. microspora]|nr:DNA replication factor C-like protein [Annulohypoxylon bovei var. microspora]